MSGWATWTPDWPRSNACAGPTHEDMQRISSGVSDVDGRLARVEGELGGLRSGLDLIHEHLLGR